jgi:hypothetical protein
MRRCSWRPAAGYSAVSIEWIALSSSAARKGFCSIRSGAGPIARDLHETVAQSLAGLRMNLGMIKGVTGATMSYLLHPPVIDEAGLVTTLRWYVNGFQ